MPTGKPQQYDLDRRVKICSKCNKEKSFDEFHVCGKSKSGRSAECIQCHSKRKYEYYNDVKGRYNSYKFGAKARGKEWDITYSQFKSYWNKPCYYCGRRIDTIGLDRIDNGLGYSINNVVPCCIDCNSGKRCMSESEFLRWIELVYIHSVIPTKNNISKIK